MTEMTKDMRRFLERLAAGEKPGPVIDRAGDRARQKCRRLGLAAYGGWEGDRQLPNRWRITEAGLAALTS